MSKSAEDVLLGRLNIVRERLEEKIEESKHNILVKNTDDWYFLTDETGNYTEPLFRADKAHWSRIGRNIFFTKEDANIYSYNLENKQTTSILELGGNLSVDLGGVLEGDWFIAKIYKYKGPNMKYLSSSLVIIDSSGNIKTIFKDKKKSTYYDVQSYSLDGKIIYDVDFKDRYIYYMETDKTDKLKRKQKDVISPRGDLIVYLDEKKEKIMSMDSYKSIREFEEIIASELVSEILQKKKNMNLFDKIIYEIIIKIRLLNPKTRLETSIAKSEMCWSSHIDLKTISPNSEYLLYRDTSVHDLKVCVLQFDTDNRYYLLGEGHVFDPTSKKLACVYWEEEEYDPIIERKEPEKKLGIYYLEKGLKERRDLKVRDTIDNLDKIIGYQPKSIQNER